MKHICKHCGDSFTVEYGYNNIGIGKLYTSETKGPTIYRFIWWKLRYEWGNWGSIKNINGTVIDKVWRRGCH